MSTSIDSPESSSKSLVCTIGDGGRREDSSLNPHHGGINLDIPGLDLGEGLVLELRSPGHDWLLARSLHKTGKLTLSHSLGGRLSCDLDHSSSLITSQLNKRDRVERFEVNELKAGHQLYLWKGSDSLRNKVLVSILNTWQSRFGDSSIVSLFVVLDNSHHLVGSTIFTSQEELDVFGRLMSESLE